MKYVISVILEDGTKIYRTSKNDYTNNGFTENINKAFIFSANMNDGMRIVNNLKPTDMNFKFQSNYGCYTYDGVPFCISKVVSVKKEQIEIKIESVGVLLEERINNVT